MFLDGAVWQDSVYEVDVGIGGEHLGATLGVACG